MKKRFSVSPVSLQRKALAISFGLAAAGAASAQQYDAVDIGVAPLNNTTMPVSGRALNNAGQVAAVSSSGVSFTSALRYTPGVGLENLDAWAAEDTFGHCINDSGQIVGIRRGASFRDPPTDFWRYTDGTGYTSLTTDPDLLSKLGRSGGRMNDAGVVIASYNDFSAPMSPFFIVVQTNAASTFEPLTPAIDPGFGMGLGASATDINNAGVIVGSIVGSGGVNQAFRYGQAIGFTVLGSLGGTITNPIDLNNVNQSCGIARTTTGEDRAFFHSDATGLIDIQSHPGALGSAAYFVNDAGTVAGTISLPAAGFPGFAERAVFTWTQATGMQDVGDMSSLVPPGLEFQRVRVEGLSETGLITGTLYAADPALPGEEFAVCWVWSASGGFVDLEASVDPAIAAAYDFQQPRGINNSGQVVIVASEPGGFNRTLLLTPTGTVACPCERDGAAGVNVFDLLAYLDLWFAGAAGAEMTGDAPASVDVFDLLSFLDCWFPASAGQSCP